MMKCACLHNTSLKIHHFEVILWLKIALALKKL